MIRRLAQSAFAFTLISTLACSGSKPAVESNDGAAAKPSTSKPAAPQGPLAAVPGDKLAQLALDHMSSLQSGTTLGEWRATHPGHEVTPYRAFPEEPQNKNWCARAKDLRPVGKNQTMRRTAYFYLPPVPDTASVPDGPQEDLLNQCRLGLVWIETADVDRARAATVADETNQGLIAALGPAANTAKPVWSGSASWNHTARWQMSDVTIVMGMTDDRWAIGSTPPEPSPGTEQDPKPTRVLIAAAGPAADVNFSTLNVAAGGETVDIRRSETRARIDEALRIAARDESLDRQMRAHLETFENAEAVTDALPKPSAAERSAFVTTLEQWMDMPGGFPAMRRAAALVAADLVLQRSLETQWLDSRQATLRRRLEAKGAAFQIAPLGAGIYLYTHSWLKQADRMSAGGRPAELAFVSLASIGFETSGACSDFGGKGFQEVIRRGEERLRTHPDSAINIDLHFLIAQGYSDIVRLADGGGGEYADADDFKAEAARARTRALEEFRVAFAADPSSPRARALWPTAWRLAAGLSATRTFFFCVYD